MPPGAASRHSPESSLSMNIPRLIIAAPMSGSGKTTIASGLIAALAARGLQVAPFKVGPDYIDPTYHSLSAGRASRNLDAWMLPPKRLGALFARGAAGADLAVVEGVMGLYDGYSGTDDAGSTAHVARLLDAPVLIVLDVSAMGRSAAAIVTGLRDFDRSIHIGGVLLNRVGSPGHARMVTQAVESAAGVPVLGYLGREDAFNLPERHLGLIPTQEPGEWRAWLDAVRERIRETVDLDRILAIARSASPLPVGDDDPFRTAMTGSRARIAVAHDAAFNFTYADNLDLLRAAGAEIVFFSPMQDAALPAGAQALYLCGGFPEIYAAQLAANGPLHAQIRAAFHSGMPIYAECGGLMYLTGAIVDRQQRTHAMVGLLPGRSEMTGQLVLGYRTARAVADNWLWRAGETVRGHEFHYSVWESRTQDLLPAYELLPAFGEFQQQARPEGAATGTLVASYVHLHFLAYPELAARMVRAASEIEPWR